VAVVPFGHTIDVRLGLMSGAGGRPYPIRSLGTVAAGVLGALVLAGVVAFLVVRPDLAARTNMPTVMRLAAEGRLVSVTLDGGALTVEDANGARLRAEGVTVQQYEELVQTVTRANLPAGAPVAARLLYPSAGLSAIPLWPMSPIILLVAVAAFVGWRVHAARSASRAP
jgi:hypothetical protein